jgi:chromosome segregation ATPase
LVLPVVLLLALSSAICSWPDPSQTKPPSSELTPQDQQQRYEQLMQILLSLKVISLQLGDDLTAWPKQIADLQDSSQALQQQVDSLQTQLQASGESLTESQAAQQQTSDALSRSQTSLTALSASFESYKAAQAQVQSDLEASLAQERANSLKWEVVGVVGASVAVLAGGYLAGHALSLW